MPEIAAHNIDRLISTEIRPMGIPRGVMPGLYERVRKRAGEPLTLQAARLIADAAGAGDTVFIATGAGAPVVLPQGETDGPLGVAALARAISRGTGSNIVILTTRGFEEPVYAALDAYEVHAEVLSLDASFAIAAARSTAAGWLESYRPTLAIAVEMKGAAADGSLHFMTGRLCDIDARLDQMFWLCRDSGIPTLGIGDGGNEIGFGDFTNEVLATHPNGHLIASTVPTDATVVAAISNWGCYGVEAMLARLLNTPELIHTPEMGVRAMEACAAAGAGDGVYTRIMVSEDGLPASAHVALVSLLKEIVETSLRNVDHALKLDASQTR